MKARRIVKVTIERTPCYGPCPIYHAEILESGEVTFHGLHFVENPGKHEWVISKGRIEMMERMIEESGYLEMDDIYDAPITDCASCITSVKYSDGLYKTIRHLHSQDTLHAPLDKLEKAIERITKICDYVGGVDEFGPDEL